MCTISDIQNFQLLNGEVFLVSAKIEKVVGAEYRACVVCRKGKCACGAEKKPSCYLKLTISDKTGVLEGVAFFGMRGKNDGMEEVKGLVGAICTLKIGARLKEYGGKKGAYYSLIDIISF